VLKLIMGFIIIGAVLWFFSTMFKKPAAGSTGSSGAGTAVAGPVSSGTA
jgi:hypothetical protein